MRIANRITIRTEQVLDYESGQRHEEILTKDVGTSEGSEGVIAPGLGASEGGKRAKSEEEARVFAEQQRREVAMRVRIAVRDEKYFEVHVEARSKT